MKQGPRIDETEVARPPGEVSAQDMGGGQTGDSQALATGAGWPPVHARLLASHRLEKALWGAASVVLLLALWQTISWLAGPRVLPSPWASLAEVQHYYESGLLLSDLAVTARRIAGAFGIVLMISITAGIALGTWKRVERLFGYWVTIFASIPSLLILIVAYLALGLNDRAAIVGVGMLISPTVTFNVWQGMKSLDAELSEMARAFGVSKRTIIAKVYFPQTLPFIYASSRLGLALTWKLMVFAELLGRSSGVGYRIQFWYSLYNIERVIASALPFILLMMFIEFAILRPTERHLFRWRREEAR